MDFALVLSNEISSGQDSPSSTSSEDSPLDEYERISALSQAERTLIGDLENVKVSPNLLEDAKDACRKRIMAILEFSKGGPLGGDEDCGIHVLDENQRRQIDEWRNPNFPSEDSTSEAPVSSEQAREEADQEEPAPAPSNAHMLPDKSTSKALSDPASAELDSDEAAQEEPAQEEATQEEPQAQEYGPNAVSKVIPERIKKYEVHEEDLPSHGRPYLYPLGHYGPGTSEAPDPRFQSTDQYIKQIRVDRGYEKVVDKDQGKSQSDEGRLPVQGKKEDRNDDENEEAEMNDEKKKEEDQEPGTSGTSRRNGMKNNDKDKKQNKEMKGKKKKDQEAGTPGSTQKKKPRKEAVLLMAMDFGPKAGGSLLDIRRRMGTERTENAKKVARRSCH